MKRTWYSKGYPYGITDCEGEVIRELIVNGHSSKEAAKVLKCSRKNIDEHIQNVFRRFGVHNRIQLDHVLRSKGIYHLFKAKSKNRSH